ncbi:MAG: DNA primase [Deltaproteobacteria bacterium RIFCSPLOWO2_12_FULL_44_12]|nr:MAG: DNA primase [Deltaproteobacteria bacterium RIFCSPHIGHO2_01_FULL_43_49]OGQ14607.1 MAG: DNA primase [Deltaproteobacteria bacterium RIFCSPHIGHO2_02_FULL_44_53]OGQ27993.1 MAG: DNA primase [Deltaproteobacteria bacterium RIFCSPHIGHO2_12_FULL_44_21]OGQ31205.1 MAG: DNA primase [Deltaproteobacteria bacterium RIFCSPLOWO2_01_FULL_45_74]OGQ43196.1 MAG: DNA primase [Deltaproteobacteria bacterium RIFCSPLOWO2_02_FULL_44_34]OGQ70671.1 MAG: DNA primase [Deltaproteobacteria bacterium RIFCSPLOWO2_12_FULL
MASKEILEEIRRRLSIVSLIGERIPLKKSGRNFKGICPFHQEKTPSFMVSDEKQIFHCFGCSTGGDIFTFLMKLDGLNFAEALEELARKAGVKLPPRQKSDTPDADADWMRQKKWALRLNEIAKDFFFKNLHDETKGTPARQYLKSRGISLELAKQLQLGFSDKSWEALVSVLSEAKAPLKLAADLGLVKKREKEEGYFDFFRARLIFPIFDVKGEIVGFGGRVLEKSDDSAKYLNSSDSILYNKSRTVYGLNWAKEAIRKQEEAILVEGYMDLISLKQAGIENVVAPLGTALTLDHLQLLKRYTTNFVVAFDGDDAGTQAAFRALPLFLGLELVPKALTLPTGMDPDNFIRQEGKEAWEKLKDRSQTLFEYFVDWVIKETGKGTAAKVEAWEKIRPLLAKVKNSVEAGIYRKKVANKLGVDEEWLQTRHETRIPNLESRTSNLEPSYPEEERLLIAAMILKPKVAKMLENIEDIFTDPTLKNLAKQLFQEYAEEKNVGLTNIQDKLDERLAGWIREMALVEEDDTVWEKAAMDCLTKIESKSLGIRLTKLNHEIAIAEDKGDEPLVLSLLTQKNELMQSYKKRTHL